MRLLLFLFFLFVGCCIGHAQADSLTRQQRDSVIAAKKKILEIQQETLRKVDANSEDSVYKMRPPLPFSFTGEKAATFSLTTLHFTNYICLGEGHRFRLASFHEGPVLLSEGNYLIQGDTLILVPGKSPSADFINAYKNYSDWGYRYDAACKWFYHNIRHTLHKQCE